MKLYFLLALISFAVYANSLQNEFVFDDESVVLSDPSITKISNVPKYLTGEEGFHKVIGPYFRPIVSASYALDYALYGFKPFGFHLTNVIIHVINSLLFLRFLILVFKPANKRTHLLVLLGAVIFAVHPIHTEAVSWVSGRTDSFSFTFFISGFIFFLLYSESRKRSRLYLMGLLYLFALMAKEMALTLPLLVICYDIFEGRFSEARSPASAGFSARGHSTTRELAPLSPAAKLKKNLPAYLILIAVSVIFMTYRWLILRQVPERHNYFYFYGEDFLTIVATMLQTIPLYFRLLFIPAPLLYHYNGYLPYQHSLLAPEVLASIAFILVLLTAAWLVRKRLPMISYCVLFFFISLAPVMNIVPTVNLMAERFLYIPSIIVSLIILEIVFIKELKSHIKIVIGFLVLLVGIYSYMTVVRNGEWKTNNDLFLSAEGKPGTVLYVNIGNIYANKNQLDIAEGYYRKAIELRDKTILAQNNLGKVFLVRGVYDSAIYYMNKAHLLDTLSPEPMFSLAQAYVRIGNLPAAIMYMEKIRKIFPNGYMNSNQILEQLRGQLLEEENLKRTPDVTMEIKKLEQQSYQEYQNKDYSKAIETLKKLVELHSEGKVGYYNNIGMCYSDQGKLKEAEKYFKLSIEAAPEFSTALNNLGKVYERMGNYEMAKEQYRLAIEADPNNQVARSNLDSLLKKIPP